ncbi:MAG: hypothetical protein ACRCX4_14290 [Bacteroidales bacterium]
MKTKLLTCLFFLLLSISSKSSNSYPNNKSDDYSTQLVESRMFMIEAREFFISDSKDPVRYATNCFLAMDGSNVEVKFDPEIYREVLSSNQIEYTDVRLEKIRENKKSADYKLIINNLYYILVSVYKKSDKCFVKYSDKISFNGVIKKL